MNELLQEDLLHETRADYDALWALRDFQEARRQGGFPSSLEDIFTDIWREAAIGGAISVGHEQWSASDLIRQLRIHLADVCGRIRADGRSHQARLYEAFLDVMDDSFRQMDIISFNYDLVCERALDAIGIQWDYGPSPDLVFYDTPRRRSLGQRPASTRLIKLHGSANWGVCDGCRKAERAPGVVTAFEKPYVPTKRRACPWCDSNLMESGIIPPTHAKAAETRTTAELWGLARKTLQNADSVVVIGYSLPEGDKEAQSLLRTVDGSHQRVTLVCGSTASARFRDVMGSVEDSGMYFEPFATDIVARLR